MDSKRDIRPKLASRLLKDSLVLHCLFRVSLATQHIIGTIIFLKQRKTRIRVTSSLNLRALGRYRAYDRALARSPRARRHIVDRRRARLPSCQAPRKERESLPVALFDDYQITPTRTRSTNNVDRTSNERKREKTMKRLKLKRKKKSREDTKVKTLARVRNRSFNELPNPRGGPYTRARSIPLRVYEASRRAQTRRYINSSDRAEKGGR